MPDIGRIFRGETVSGLSEWQLLERYLERRDEIAFEALVARHGPMVLGICRRMLVDQGDVEDAFQATFLVLVRRARQLGPRDAIGPWLYGVAARVAMRSRSEAARRRRLTPISDEVPAAAGDTALVDRELGEVLDQELSRLPSKYRSPVVLCYLEGQTHEEAARLLAWPVGTVKGRLARARDLLRSRLARRGLTPTISALTFVLARDSKAALHRELLDRTVKSSLTLAMGQAAVQVVSTSTASLVQGVLTSMLLTKLKWAGAVVLVSGLALTGAGVMARQNARQQPNGPPAAIEVAVDSAAVIPTTPVEPSINSTSAAFETEAELLLAQASSKQSEKPKSPEVNPGPAQPAPGRPEKGTGPGEGRGQDPYSRLILAKLDEPVSMSFNEETPLESVLKYVKHATTSATYSGIPIYVDPVGLQRADKSMTSTVRNMVLEGVPLRRTLQLLLKQLELIYFVEDGMLYITSQDSEPTLGPTMPEPSPLEQKIEKAERGELTMQEMKELIEMMKTLEEIRKLDQRRQQ